MPVAITFTVRNDNPNTIANRLAARLGREPTHAELVAEVRRILSEAEIETSEAHTFGAPSQQLIDAIGFVDRRAG